MVESYENVSFVLLEMKPRIWLLGLLLVLLPMVSKPTIIPGGTQLSQSGVPTHPNDNTRKTPSKYALLVGINDYQSQGLTELKGCLNDVVLMEYLLKNKFNFPGDNILTLTNENATSTAIIEAFVTHLIQQAEPGSIVLFYFSGHGSQIKDISGDETDGMDETIVAVDSREPGKSDITDDRLNELFSQLSKKTKNVTFIIDACHSGTLTRHEDRLKSAPLDKREELFKPQVHPQPFDNPLKSVMELNSDYVLISGCSSNEYAFEYDSKFGSFGAMTYFLVSDLLKTSGQVTYRDVLDKVRAGVGSVYSVQHPQAEGDLLDNYIFSDSSSLPEPHLLINPTPGKTVIMEAGKMMGISSGSIFEIYPPMAKKMEPGVGSIGKVRIDFVGLEYSKGTLIEGGPVTRQSRAIERFHHFEGGSLIVDFKGNWEKGYPKDVRKSILELPYLLEGTSSGEQTHLELEYTGKKIILSLGNDGENILLKVDPSNPLTESKLIQQIETWGRWFNILSIENPNSNLQIDFQIKQNCSRGKAAIKRSLGVLPLCEETYHPGDEFCLYVKNNSKIDLYLHVLDMDTKGHISVIFPEKQGAKEILPAGQEWTKTVEAFLPKGRKSTKDVLMVFATHNPSVDLKFLTMKPEKNRGARKSLKEGCIEQLVDDIWKGVMPKPENKIELETWTTVKKGVKVVSE